MNKTQLIEKLASELETSKGEAARTLDAVLGAITEGVRTEEKVMISGFGTFEKRTRAARRGVNPITKEEILDEASTTCGFRAAAGLKQSL